MKRIPIHKVATLAMLLLSAMAFTNVEIEDIPPGYTVVVSAYSNNKVAYAKYYVKKLSKLGYEANYGLNHRKSLVYVYVYHTQSYGEAISKMREMRTKDGFEETWVYRMRAAKSEPADTSEALKDSDEAPESKDQVAGETPVEDKAPKNADRKDGSIETNDGEQMTNRSDSTIVEAGQGKDEMKPDTDEKTEKDKPEDKLDVRFRLVNSSNGEEVAGQVQIIDTERSRLMQVVNTNGIVAIKDPQNGSGALTFIADVFGYRKLQKEFNYLTPYPPSDTSHYALVDSTDSGPLVTMELVRYRAGDIEVMYNVFFYNNASVMQPESKYEVNNLLSMMEENENLKIKIHGHINGRAAGEIIPRRDTNFFALPDNTVKGFGSAKELSKQRARTIKDYLVYKGVEAERLEIKAWGGRRMLYDKNSMKAKENVRVEIEILED